MNPLAISVTVLVVTFGGSLLGMYLRERLPDVQLTEPAVGHIKTIVGLLTSMFALLLSLQLSSAKSSFDREESGVTAMAAMAMSLDRRLAHYGPETNEARAALRSATLSILNLGWPQGRSEASNKTPIVENEVLFDKIEALSAKDDAQRAAKASAESLVLKLQEMRWEAATSMRSSTALPLMLVEISWAAIVFISFGIIAPRNMTFITSLFICAAAVAAGFFLIGEMNTPYDGIIRVSSAPLREALERISR
jgi:hypothetical protein